MGYEQYGAANYMGEHSGDATALSFVQSALFDTAGDGSGNPRDGAWYYNTTDRVHRYYSNGRWVSGMFTSTGVDPPINPVPGELWWNSVAYVLYYWDDSRLKWLSTSELVVVFGDDNTDGDLLRAGGIINARAETGILVQGANTLVGVTASVAGGNQAKTFRLYNVDLGTPIHEFSTVTGIYSSDLLSLDMDSGIKIWMRSLATGIAARDVYISYRYRGRYVAP